MSKQQNTVLRMVVGSMILGNTVGAIVTPAQAETTRSKEKIALQDAEFALESEDSMAQVTSVSQLTDIRPTDWAFQALQSLVERYGCISGYPDKTYRGNRAITRYEFAAGLNACMDRINDLIAASTKDSAKKEDLATLRKLQDTFAAELATLKGRVDGLESRTATLEKQQFSTTTKLYGQTIVGLQSRFANRADLNPRNGIKDTDDPATQINLGYSTQLSLATQFSDRSMLLLGLQAGNLSTRAGNNNLPYFLNDSYTRLAYESNTNNNLLLSDITYRFAPTKNLAVIVGAIGVGPVTVFRGPNRYESSGQGPISAFAQRNPILNIGGAPSGIGLDWQVNNRLSLQAVYAAGNASDPTIGNGLFNGPSVMGIQVAALPLPTVDLTAYYLRSYTQNAFLGTGVGDDLIGFVGSRFTTDAIGSTLSWRANSKLTLGGWVGFTSSTVAVPNYGGGVSTSNWMAFANFPDLFAKGNLGGIYFGQPPKITRSDLTLGGLSGLNIPGTISGLSGASGGQPSSTYHVEAFYRFQVNDNISVTPGMVVLFNPVQTAGSDPIVIGTVRTTFTF